MLSVRTNIENSDIQNIGVSKYISLIVALGIPDTKFITLFIAVISHENTSTNTFPAHITISKAVASIIPANGTTAILAIRK